MRFPERMRGVPDVIRYYGSGSGMRRAVEGYRRLDIMFQPVGFQLPIKKGPVKCDV